jgi:hypothetical protein
MARSGCFTSIQVSQQHGSEFWALIVAALSTDLIVGAKNCQFLDNIAV